MKRLELAYEIIKESKKSRALYLESGRDYHKVAAHMYSIFECYAHGLINWNTVRSYWHNSNLEYLNLYKDNETLYVAESNRMLAEYETTLKRFKPALDEYKKVSEAKMTSNIVVKNQISESVAAEQSNLYYNKRNLSENAIKEIAHIADWKKVVESYPNLTATDKDRLRMLTIFENDTFNVTGWSQLNEGPTLDTTQMITTVMSEGPAPTMNPNTIVKDLQANAGGMPSQRAGMVGSMVGGQIGRMAGRTVAGPVGGMIGKAIGTQVGTQVGTNMANKKLNATKPMVATEDGMTSSPRPVARPGKNLPGGGYQWPNGAVEEPGGFNPTSAAPRPKARPAMSAPSAAPATSLRPKPRPATKSNVGRSEMSPNPGVYDGSTRGFESVQQEGYKTIKSIDKERYDEIPGLEGPFMTLSGKVVYYDPKEGSYYDRDTDMYLSYDEFKELDNDYSGMKNDRQMKEASATESSDYAKRRKAADDDDDRDELTKKLFPRRSRDDMEKSDRERNRAMNAKRFMKPGQPSRSREWGAYESVSEAEEGTYMKQWYDYSEDFAMLELYVDGKLVDQWSDYFGANVTGNPLQQKFIDMAKKNGVDPIGLKVIDGEDGNEGVFTSSGLKWNSTEAKAKSGHNAKAMARAQEIIRKSIEKSQEKSEKEKMNDLLPSVQRALETKVSENGIANGAPSLPSHLKVVKDWKDVNGILQAVVKNAIGNLYELEFDPAEPDMINWAELDPEAYAKGKIRYGNSGNDDIEDLQYLGEVNDAQVDEAMTPAHKKLAHDVHKQLKRDEPMAGGPGMTLKSNHKMLRDKYGADWKKKAGIKEARTVKLSKKDTVIGQFSGARGAKLIARRNGAYYDLFVYNEYDSTANVVARGVSAAGINKVLDADWFKQTVQKAGGLVLDTNAIQGLASVAEAAYEKDMDHDKPVVVSGVKGMKSTPFRKKFKNMAAYDKWSDSEEAGNYEVHDVMNESVVNEGYADRVQQVADRVNKAYQDGLTRNEMAKIIAHYAYDQVEMRGSEKAKRDFIKDIAAKVNVKRDTAKSDANRATKEKILQYLATAIEDAVGSSVPDGDPWDWIEPKGRKLGIEPDDLLQYLDLAARKHLGAKGYHAYLKSIWDAYGAGDLGMDPPAGYRNPWGESTVKESSSFKLKVTNPATGNSEVQEFNSETALNAYKDRAIQKGLKVSRVNNESVINEGDIVDFGMFAGMYADGATVSFMDKQGQMHTITATGGIPREYTLDGNPISREKLKQITQRVKLGRFRPGIDESANVNEAVTLDYSRHMRSHGRKPRDPGYSALWMFTTREYGMPDDDEIFKFQGSFADAKKAAAKWAKSQGAYRVYVME